MDEEIEELLLTGKLFFVVFGVDDQVAIVTLFFDVFVLHLVFHDVDLTRVIGHVCRQDHSDDALSQHLLFVFRERLNEVVAGLEQDAHGLRSMPVLLNGLVVVPERPVSHEVDVVGIVVAIVVVVMARCRRDRSDQVEIVQLSHGPQVPIFDEHEHTLCHVCAM